MVKNHMVDEQTLVKWIVGLVTTLTASFAWWVRREFGNHAGRMAGIELTAKEAADDRQAILVEIRGLAIEMKHLRKDHEQMKDDHKELSHQLAAHMHQEIVTMQKLSENLAVMQSQLASLPKRIAD